MQIPERSPNSTRFDAPRTTAEILVEGLESRGVRHVFGMPGSHSTTLYDAIARCDSLRTILIRNEQAGAFSADGYARVTGRPGLICTTAGPGATNAITGVSEAWADSVPILLLTGQVNADRMHEECGAYHEIDLEGLLRPVTTFLGTVRSPEQARTLLESAWQAMTTRRPRPAALILPRDVMRRPVASLARAEGPAPCEAPSAPDPVALDRAAALLKGSERPVLLAGGGALWSGAGREFRELVERLGAVGVTSLNGKGLLDELHPRSLGHARSAGARLALPEADAMLAIGCRFTEVMTAWRTMPVPARLIQVDLDPDQIGMNHPVEVGIVADARAALLGLLQRIGPRARSGWDAILPGAKSARPTRPEWLIETLREVLPDEAVVFADACEIGYRLQTDWVVRGPRRFFYPSNFITLGWAFPAAIGGAVGLEGKAPVVSVSGDGGFLMTAQELATASRYSLKVIAVVHNDSAYGAIKNIQAREHGGRHPDVDLNNPDFVALAESFGVPATRVRDAPTLAEALRVALGRAGPSLIEVPDTWRPIRAGA